MLTIRRFQKGDEEILSVMIRRTLREVNYTLQVFNFRFSGGVGKHRDALRAAGRQRKHQRRRAEDGYELFHKMTSFVILLRFMEKGSGGPLPLLCRYHIPPT